jgi:HlyD family secretion protein
MNRIIVLLGMAVLSQGCGPGAGRATGSGTIECTQVHVAPLVSGRILELPAEEGAALSKGDLVAKLDPTDYQLRRDEADAAARAAEADWRRIREVFGKSSATQKQMDDAQAARDLALTRRALAEKALADCVIVAPMDGVVTTRSREVGEYVGPGATLITLSRLDEVWLSVYVPENLLPNVKLGQIARVKLDGDPRFHDGRVTFISPEAEFTPRNVQTPEERVKLVYRVKITLPNPDGLFKPGMPADGYLEGP